MIVRYVRLVIAPALWWALFASAGFVGIGGISLEGAGASHGVIQRLWEISAILATITFIAAFVIFTKKKRAQLSR